MALRESRRRAGATPSASRPAIERAVRRRVESRGNTTLYQRCRVQEVLATPSADEVTGVRYEPYRMGSAFLRTAADGA